MPLSSPAVSPPPPPAASSRPVAKRMVLTVGSVFIALLLAMAWVTIIVQRQQAVDEWRGSLVTLSRLLAEHAHQSVKAAELVQKSIGERVTELGVNDERGLRRRLGDRATFDMLNDKVSGVPQIDVATIVAANGDVINFTRSYPPPPINLADRDYFKDFTDPALPFFLSSPVKSRGTGRWTFYLTRKIKSVKGDAVGLTLTGIESSFFSDYYKAVNFSEYSAISLYRTDGTLLARIPDREESMGKVLAEQPAMKALRQGRESFVTDEPRLVDSSDTRMRIVAVRAVPDYPLAVVVTATEELVLAAWRQRALLIGGGAILLSLVFAGLMAWIVRLLANRDAAVARLRQSEAELAQDSVLLTRKNQELEQFSYVASHDLRQPLRMVSSYLGLIERRLGPNLGDDMRDFLGFAVDGAKRMDRLILDLLEYSRTGKAGEMEPVPLAKAIADSLSNLSVAVAEAGAEIIVAENLPTIMGNRIELARLFQNLLGNAIKYRQANRAPHITVSCRPDGDAWLIGIHDNGIGIAQQDHERVFAIFQRLHGPDQYDGTGIGLAICKKIVEQHGGRIWVESIPGAGSTFRFTLAAETGTATALKPQRS